MFSLPLEWHQARGTARTLQVLTSAEDALSLVTNLWVQLLAHGPILLISGAFLAWLSPWVLLAWSLGLGLLFCAGALQARLTKEATMGPMRVWSEVLQAGSETTGAREWVEMSGLQRWALGRLAARLTNWTGLRARSVAKMSFGALAFGAARLIGENLLIAVAAGLALRGEGIGIVAATVFMAGILRESQVVLMGLPAQAVELRFHLDRLRDVMEAEDPSMMQETHSALVRGEMAASGLTFTYWPGGDPVLVGVDLWIEPGTMVGIVGESGSGKSTLALLLGGVRFPTAGEVLLDGVSTRVWDQTSLRQQVAVVLQVPEIFAGSVRYNLTLGDEAIPDDTCWEALRRAELADKIRELGGLDAEIDTEGVNISGGERQRLTIARALVGDPRVLILDEATSALDVDCEIRIYEHLKAMGITRIVVTHRTDRLTVADRVLRLTEGRIHESS